MRSLQIRLDQLEPSAMSASNVMEALGAPDRNVHAARVNFQNVQGHAGKIHRCDMLPARGKKQGISSRATSNVQRRARRQKRQEFSDDTRWLGGELPRREPVLGIPIGLARRHKKGS